MIRKPHSLSFFVILIFFVSLLGACQSASAPTTPTPQLEAYATDAPASTSDLEAGDTPEPTETAASTGSSSTTDFPASGTMPGCTVFSMSGESDPQVAEIFGSVTESDWIYGNEDAAVTIVEYGDFQCPYCRLLSIVLAQLKNDYPDDLRIVYRHYPLPQLHDKAYLATQASEAAGEQGKFWEFHDIIYGEQNSWNAMPKADFETWLIQEAQKLGLDVAQFEAKMNAPETVAFAEAAYQNGSDIGLPGTPFLLINDQPYTGPSDYTNLSLIIRLLAFEKRQFKECPPIVIDPSKQYIATLETENGEIVIELLPDKAPIAVNNFVFLAREGWYDGITFHRVLAGFMAQAGDPTGTGYAGPGYAFVNETSDMRFNQAGLVAMANSGPDSNGSQFFVTYAPTPQLDGGYTIFGRVLSGQDVADAITLRDPSQGNLPPGDLIVRVTIEEK